MRLTIVLASLLMALTVSACTTPAPAARPMVTVKMAQLDPPPVGSAPLLIALEKGYFAEQDINVDLVPFGNSSDIAAPLAANQVDAGVLGVNVGLFNAFNRGIKVVLAADGGSSRPGFDYTAIVVRKALVDSGRFKSAADFKGLKVSIPSRGTPADYGFAQLLQPVGLTLADVDLQTMGFPNMLPALVSGSIDSGWEIEPFLTQALDGGDVVVFKHGEEFVPGAELATLAFSAQFAANPDVASRFLAGWLKGAGSTTMPLERRIRRLETRYSVSSRSAFRI